VTLDPATRETLEGARQTRPAMPEAPPAHPVTDAEGLREAIQTVMAQYPQRRSALIPALRLAQEHYGWLSTEAFEIVADAMGYTPALCRSVASFYDMFHTEPVGRHEICVCTNVSCALVGAGETLRAFERELGINAGETTADGMFTLRAVECYGGCGWGPVVSVDERYHEPFPPDDVRGLVADLRSRAAAVHEREPMAHPTPEAGA
jgi:NADH-quinone oxidoreductase subunit E